MSLCRYLHVYALVYILLTCESKDLSTLNEIPAVSKCCPKDKQLNENVVCIDYNGGTNASNNYPWWLPENVSFSPSDSLEPLYPEEVSHKSGDQYDKTYPCKPHEIVTFGEFIKFLSDGSVVIDRQSSNWTFSRTSYCTDRVEFGPESKLATELNHSFVILLCNPCEHVACVRKCCYNDLVVEIKTLDGYQAAECVKGDTSLQNDTGNGFFIAPGNEFFITQSFPKCPRGVYKQSFAGFQLLDDGSLQSGDINIPSTEYCIDYVNENYPVESFLACVQPPTVNETQTFLYAIFLCVGSVFLVATLLVHLLLPELRRKMPSYNLISHVVCLLVGHVCMVLINFLYRVLDSILCVTLAFLIQFSFLGAFFWLSVMCIDISWTFSGLRPPQGNTVLNSDNKKFLYYSLYAWGSTSLISVVTAVLEFVPGIPQTKFTPRFGEERCWFKHSEAVLLLFYGPMAILLFGNLLLFIYTAAKITIARRNTAILSNEGSYRYEGRSHAEDKHRFALYLKLFCLMGLTWVFEILSWAIHGSVDTLWYITDAINALRGVFIFIIFCCKKKVYTLLKAKFCKHKINTNNSNRTRTDSITPSCREMSSQRTNSFQLS